jgi:DNA-binding phage protein
MMNQNDDLIGVEKDRFSPYRVTEYLTNTAEITAYLKAAKEENDPELLAAAIEDIHQIEQRQKDQTTLRGKQVRPV